MQPVIALDDVHAFGAESVDVCGRESARRAARGGGRRDCDGADPRIPACMSIFFAGTMISVKRSEWVSSAVDPQREGQR